MKELLISFSKKLKERRRALGLTQKELAERIAYSEKAVSKWERGNALPPSCLLPELSRILEVTIDELMSVSDDIRYYLGIDGGGTKTEFLLTDATGKQLRRVLLGASNPNDVGLSRTEEILDAGIREVTSGYNLHSISVFAGIAGARTSDNVERIEAYLSRFGFGRVGCDSDMETAVAAGLLGGDGIVVILGTGSVINGRCGDERFRIGGYGYILGDPLSGFNLSRDAIYASLRCEDGSAEKTVLLDLFYREMKVDSLVDSISVFYSGGKREVAKYAPLVFEAARQGDKIALEILNKNARELSDMIRVAGKKFDTPTVKTVLFGSLAEKTPEILQLILENLSCDTINYEISVCDRSSVRGAIYLAGLKQ